MAPLTPADVCRPVAYWPIRAAERRRMIELRRHRRLMLGDLVSLVFENRDTVKGMIEAILCAGWIEDPERIAAEVDLFKVLVPSGDDLRATLFVAARDRGDLQLLRKFQDTLVPHVHLVFPDGSVATADELGEPEGTPTVRYVRFRVDAAERHALRHAGTDVAIVVDHPRYSARTVLTALQREALSADLD